MMPAGSVAHNRMLMIQFLSYSVIKCVILVHTKFVAPLHSLIWQSLIKKYGNKKDVGVISSAPIPILRLSHCPHVRISNASQPTPSDII